MSAYVLYVEDDDDDVELTTSGLQKYGFTHPLKIARDGEEALASLERAVRESAPLPAAVLIDIKMPKMSGFELLRRLRADPVLERVPAAILTSSSCDVDRAQALELGAELYMLKPSDLSGYGDLAARLNALIASRTKVPR